MKIFSEYVKEVIKNPKLKTVKKLCIDSELLRQMFLFKEVSEKKVREIGYPLLWVEDKLYAGSLVTGKKAAVDFLPPDIGKDKTVIGSFHTHPYLVRMGERVSVGFSASDIGAFEKARPTNFPLGINFVFSNKILFLVIFRTNTVVNLAKLDKIITMSGGPDAHSAWKSLAPKMQSLYSETLDIIEDLEAQGKDEEAMKTEKALMEKIPAYGVSLKRCNKVMNIEYANEFKYDFYYKRMDTTYKPGDTVTLELRSKPSN